MQAKHMPTAILSDHVSVGGKSQMHQPNKNVLDLIGENMVTRSNLTDHHQVPARQVQTNEQEF